MPSGCWRTPGDGASWQFITGDVLLRGLETIRAQFEDTYAGLAKQDQTIREKRVRILSPDVALVMARKQVSNAAEGSAVVGAATGAVAGTAIGAIAGNTGKGAAIGAVAGAMGGLRAPRQAEEQAATQGAQRAQVQNKAALDTFKKAAGACLEGRGYTVK
jgi:hypothetical protein